MPTPWGIAKQIGTGFMEAAGLQPLTKDDYINFVNRTFSTPEKVAQSARGQAIPQNITDAFAPRPGTVSLTDVLPKPKPIGAISQPKAVNVQQPPKQVVALQQPNPVLSKFSNGMDATPENARRSIELGLPGAVAANEATNPERPVYGETPGSGYIYGGRDFMAKGSGPATGGFSRPSTADANLAFEDEQNRLVAEQSRQDQLRREYNDELQGQRNFDGNINWALNNPNAPGAAYYLAQLQQGRKIGQQVTPLSERQSNLYKVQSEGFSKEAAGQNQLAEARTRQAALPYIGPKAEAETGLQNAQAQYYSDRNTVELGSARAKALADVLAAKQKQTGKGALDPKTRIDLENMAMTNPEGYAKLAKEFGIAGW